LIFSLYHPTAILPDENGLWVNRRRSTACFLFFLRSGIMPQGTIKKLIADKGFGFIQGERGELFFHHSSVQGASFETLQEGQRVSYDEGRGPKGPRADNVKVL
jgi:cold shock protein